MTEEELSDGSFVFRDNVELLDLVDKPTWVRIEEDHRCDCLTKDSVTIRHESVGYGRSLYVAVDFKNKVIRTSYDHKCDRPDVVNLPISHCPLCGRDLSIDAPQGKDFLVKSVMDEVVKVHPTCTSGQLTETAYTIYNQVESYVRSENCYDKDS